MKTKIAKLFIFLLCVALMFSIAACSERAGNVDDGTGGIVPPTDNDNKEKFPEAQPLPGFFCIHPHLPL